MCSCSVACFVSSSARRCRPTSRPMLNYSVDDRETAGLADTWRSAHSRVTGSEFVSADEVTNGSIFESGHVPRCPDAGGGIVGLSRMILWLFLLLKCRELVWDVWEGGVCEQQCRRIWRARMELGCCRATLWEGGCLESVLRLEIMHDIEDWSGFTEREDGQTDRWLW
jgi:hypothetical protein